MNRRLRLVFLPFLLCSMVSAQNAERGRGLPDTRVLFVDATTIDGLTTLVTRDDVDAVTLDVTRAALDARPAAEQALLSWVARGGVVYVHSDAAQLFGYRTIPARPATARQAGQFFGRARGALPLGGHRLLWGNATRPTRGPRSLEVRLVFYQMTAGDQLVVDHPAGVGLLAVTDLAGPPMTRPLFAAAVAPFGAGWALFTPYFIETHRADGAAFVQNLSRFAVEAGATARHNIRTKYEDGDLVAVPGSLLDRAPGVGEAGAATWARLLLPTKGVTTGGENPAADTTPQRIALEPVLLVTRRDVRALSFGLSPDAGEPAQNAARALLVTLRARLALQRNLPQRATEQVAIAAQLAPQAAETLWLQGALAAAFAQDLSQSSQTRAVAFRTASQNWDGALRGTSLSAYLVSQDPARLPGATTSTAATLVADVPRDLVQLWRDNLAFSASQTAAEPPLSQTLGAGGGSATVMRFFANDPTLNLLGPTANLLSRGDSTVGWHADRQEVLLFPNVNYLRSYRAAAGVYPQQAILPEPWRGDVNGSRILMMSSARQLQLGGANPIQNNDPFIGGQTPDLIPAVLMARLHAYVLIDALAEGGTRVPVWMQLGLSGMVNAGTTSDLVAASRMAQATTMSLQARGLFTPEQFARASIPVNTLTSAEAQGLRLMLFFYNRFGAGRVAETLQRLGSGQSVDAALQATTGLTEAQFFAEWYRADFGG